MKKLLMAAAALTIVFATAPGFIGQSEAASVKRRVATTEPEIGPGSQYCKLASFQRNAPSWNEHYRCLTTAQRQPFAQAPAPARAAPPMRAAAAGPDWGPGSQYCKIASFQRNAPSWNEYYGCLRR